MMDQILGTHRTQEPQWKRNMRAAVLLYAAALLALLPLPKMDAHAGDIAGHEILGFSEDHRHFAFMAYGISDGSGTPYAAIYILDMDADRYVAGSPFRSNLGEQDVPLSLAVRMVRNQAEQALKDVGITMPAILAAANPPLQPDIDHQTLKLHPIPVLPYFDEAAELTISTFPLAGPDYCPQPDKIRGYELQQTDRNGTQTVHRDSRLPKSRGCALDYQIAGVWIPVDTRGERAVALISVISSGFEGQRSRRFAAIPLKLRTRR